MKKIAVLGAGMVGSAMARDLSKKNLVCSFDINIENLNSLNGIENISTHQADLSRYDDIPELIRDYDLVIGAVPGFMGYRTVEKVIEAKKNIVDISFFPENCLALDSLAREAGVIAIVDCGVAPGMGNILLGYHNAKMDIQHFECLVGGLPFERRMPFQYKAPFSPVDVLEEYTRPARYVENGNIITRTAMSDLEYVDFTTVGTLESFNSDGLRSLIYTMKIPNMKEKTLRYPGHIRLMCDLRDAGFFSSQEIQMGKAALRPIDFTSKILFDSWKLNPGDKEFTIMRITIDGTESGNAVSYIYNLFDEYDEVTSISSMARTTGYTATAAAELILQNKFNRIGISPPEFIGESELATKFILDYLAERNVNYKLSIVNY
ncbi:MAG: saccharopine dehydrogenase NADP-binding domain-containing protein [Candidatus Kapabacteria bacterium]|nr:saccharopine dehydrogenase NADP-binding domain-containing protein [Candidatus Kapabacteria bacterium]